MNLANLSFSKEPALWIGFADALIVALITFGVPITEPQKSAIDLVLTAAAAILIRSQVSPVASLPPALHPLDTLVPDATPVTPEIAVVPPAAPH